MTDSLKKRQRHSTTKTQAKISAKDKTAFNKKLKDISSVLKNLPTKSHNTSTQMLTTITNKKKISACQEKYDFHLRKLKRFIRINIETNPTGFLKEFLNGSLSTLNEYKNLAIKVAGIANNPINVFINLGRLFVDSNYRAEISNEITDIYNATKRVVGQVNEVANALQNGSINNEDVRNYFLNLFDSVIEKSICSVVPIIAGVNRNPARSLGSLTTEIIIQAFGGAELKAVNYASKGRILNKATGGAFTSGSLLQRMIANKTRNTRITYSPKKTKDISTKKTTTKKTTPPKNNQTSTTGRQKAKPNKPCPECPKKGNPTNPIQGCKIQGGEAETDFILTGDLPLVWDRQYVSDSTVGRGRAGDAIGWYGQGWGNTWTLCLNVRPSEDLVQLIDAYGREINFPYIAIGSSFYSRYEDIRLHHDAPGQYRLTAGASETGDGIALHFGEAEPENLVYPRYTTYYCTGQSDSYGNRITLSYHQHADKAHLPQYIQDSVGRLIQLEFAPYKDTEHYRLIQVNELINLSQTALQQLPPSVQQAFATLSIPQHLDYAKQLIADNKAPTTLITTKPLVAYRYSEQGDLTEVYRYQDQPNDLQFNNLQTIRPSRRYEWRNHIMIAHHFADGISSYYKYNKHTLTGKVIENRINNGQTYHFDYHDGYTIVTEAKDTPNESQTIYHFNEELRWTGITDGNGNHTQFILDSFGRLIQQIDPDGHIQTFSYTGDNLTAINQLIDIDPTSQQPLWRTQQYTYSQGRLSNLIDPLGNSTHIQYDEHGQPTVITDANGHNTQIERDSKGRVSKQTLANGSTYRYEYDLVGNLTQQTDCSGYTTHYQYDDIGRLTQVTDPMGQTTQYRYDTADYRTASPVQIRYPDGTQEQFTYDRQGRLLTYTDAKAQSTHYQYEIDDLPRQRTDALGHTLSYHYDNRRRLIRLTNENGEDWTFTYDKADNLIFETRFDGTTAHYNYSKAGLLKHQLDTGLHHYYRYDRAGQLTDKYSLTDRHHLNKSYLTPKHLNHSDPYPYAYSDSDYQHHRQPILDKNRPHRLRYQYDMAGQLIKATSPHATTTFVYDPVGQLISETLQRHHSHSELNSADDDSSTLTQTLTYAYDELGNRTKTTLPDGKQLNQLYYGSGHLYNQSLTDESGNIQEIRHSTTNPLHQEVTRQQGELLSSFGYDPMGRLTKQYSSNDSHIVIQRDYAYDKVGQLTQIASKTRLTQLVPNKPTQTIVNHYQRNHQYGYDTIGRLVSHKLSDYQHHAGIQERFAFDPASNRVPLPSDSSQSSQPLSQPSSQVDAKTKRPTSLITQGKKIGYVYDRHGRVQFKTIVPVDKAGNELKQSSQSIVGYLESLQLFYNTNNELEKSVNIHQQGFEVTITTTLYYYDAFGRRVGKSSEVQKASKLNQRGKLVRFPDSLINLRRTEKSQRQSMLMLWDGNRQIQEYTIDHIFTTIYNENSFEPVARIVQLSAQNEKQRVADGVAHVRRYVPSGIITQEVLDNIEKAKIPLIKIYHYHCNHLGTPQELSDESGDIIWLSYDRAWGECYDKFYKSQSIDSYEILAEQLQPIRFQGQMLDIETGFHYNRFRYYDSDVGMFISRDPIGLFGGDNVFAYAPNPNDWIDPLGLTKKWNRNLPVNNKKNNKKSLSNCIKSTGLTVSPEGQRKTDILFNNKNDAMNYGMKLLGGGTNLKRTYNDKGQWNGWKNSKGSVYWNHADWARGEGSSTFPHLNYEIDGKAGHLFMKDKIENSGMVDEFIDHYKLEDIRCK